MIAQVAQELNPQILWWLGLIIAMGGAVKAAIYLVGRMRHAGSRTVLWYDERKRVRKTLAHLTDDEGWPNGSKSIVESHNALYDKVDDLQASMKKVSEDAVERVAELQTSIDNLSQQVEQLIIEDGRHGDRS